MKVISLQDSVERLKELTSNNMKNIEDGEPLNILPFIDRSSLTIAFDKKRFQRFRPWKCCTICFDK